MTINPGLVAIPHCLSHANDSRARKVQVDQFRRRMDEWAEVDESSELGMSSLDHGRASCYCRP